MFQRVHSLNYHTAGTCGTATAAIEQHGHAVMRGVFDGAQVAALRDELLRIYDTTPPDMRASATSVEIAEMYRYRVFEYSAAVQRAIADERILDALTPLLGADLHIIACTAWRNPVSSSCRKPSSVTVFAPT